MKTKPPKNRPRAQQTPPSRRQVLRAGATAGALALLPVAADADDPGESIVDAHSHIWTRDTDRFPLKAGTTKADLDPPSFTTEELLSLTKPLGVSRAVLIAHTQFYGFDNTYMTDAVERFPDAFRVVGMVDDRLDNPDQSMKELLPQGVTGFRITPSLRGRPTWLNNPGMRKMWACAAETGQAMCCLIDAQDLAAVDQMCQQFPETTVVIDHFARIGVDGTIRKADIDQLCALARFPRTFVKVSAFYALGKKQPPYHDLIPMIRRLHGEFGAKRLMWASDAPYQIVGAHSYAASLALARDQLDFLSPDEKSWLLRRTAEAVFFSA